MVRFNWFD